MFFFIIFLLLLGIVLEGSVTVLPLGMLSLLFLVIFGYGKQALFAAFIAGILLDVFLLRMSGLSGTFFIMFVFVMILYQRKFEINSYQFVLFSSFFGSLIYLYLFDTRYSFLFAMISSLVSIILYSILRRLYPLLQKHKSLHYTL